MIEVALAPPGWGWRPGALLAADDETVMALLPELPLLRLVGPGESRNRCVAEALRELPQLQSFIRPRHLVKKYGVPQVSASTLLVRMQGEKFREGAAP